MTCPQIVDSGAYVLGALSPAARAAYERHLPTCAECRAEVGDLAGLPGLLGRLDQDALNPPGPGVPRDPAPPSVVAGTLLRVRRQRRQRRMFASLAAVALAVVALVAGFALPRAHAPTPVSTVVAAPDASSFTLTDMTPVGRPTPVTASIGVRAVTGGTEIYMRCRYSRDGLSPAPSGIVEWAFSLYVVPRDGGAAQQVGTWTARDGDTVSVPAMTSWRIADMASIEIRNAKGVPLLTYSVSG